MSATCKFNCAAAAAALATAEAATEAAVKSGGDGSLLVPTVFVAGLAAVAYLLLSGSTEGSTNNGSDCGVDEAPGKKAGGNKPSPLADSDGGGAGGDHTEVAARFMQKQLAFTKDGHAETEWKDNPVPGIGDKGQQALEEHGVSNAAVLVGWYLRLNGDRERMAEFLVDSCGCHRHSVVGMKSNTLDVLREKCRQFVLDAPDSSSPATARPAGAPASWTLVLENFLNRQLSWADDFDSFEVPKLGPKGRAKLAESQWRITNAVQLVGHYMTFNGDDDEFVEFLVRDCELRPQEVTGDGGILAGIKEKVQPFCSL